MARPPTPSRLSLLALGLAALAGCGGATAGASALEAPRRVEVRGPLTVRVALGGEAAEGWLRLRAGRLRWGASPAVLRLEAVDGAGAVVELQLPAPLELVAGGGAQVTGRATAPLGRLEVSAEQPGTVVRLAGLDADTLWLEASAGAEVGLEGRARVLDAHLASAALAAAGLRAGVARLEVDEASRLALLAPGQARGLPPGLRLEGGVYRSAARPPAAGRAAAAR